MENEKKLEIRPKISIAYYFIRNIWMFVMYFFVFIISLIVKGNLNSLSETLNSAGTHLMDIVVVVLLIATIIIYLYKTIQMYLHTRRIKYTFYNDFVRYEDEFLNKNSKDINYDKITEISMSQNVWDRALKTGTIHIKTSVESDVGIYMPYVINPKEVVEDIREVIGK